MIAIAIILTLITFILLLFNLADVEGNLYKSNIYKIDFEQILSKIKDLK